MPGDLINKALREPRKGMESGRQQTYRAYALQVKFKDGRRSEGFAWAWFNFYQFETSPEEDVLTLLFTHRAVILKGFFLHLLLPKIEDENLHTLQELTDREAFMQVKENERVPVDQQLPAITSAETVPNFNDLIQNLTMKEEEI